MGRHTECPRCGSPDAIFSKKLQLYICEDCRNSFEFESEFIPRRVFISYGHDEHVALADRLKEDLQVRGHEVWFDRDRLRAGTDWEVYIEHGIDWVSEFPSTGRVVLLMTPYSVRRPDGFCLNEIARVLSRRLSVIPVMVVWCEPPLSICRIQWLDMQDCVPPQERRERYEVRLARLTEALEEDQLDFEGTQSRLLQLFEPLPFDADLAQHLSRFTGRKWVFDHIDAWLADPKASRVFWIAGKPGVGKTAIAAWLCHHRREVAAFHLCRYGHDEKSDPRRCVLSLAYQLASQLPHYQTRLSDLNLERIVPTSNAQTLFDTLIVQPLSGIFPKPNRMIVILIDALDEATKEGKNELAAFIASEFAKTPEWLRLIITSRPDAEVMHSLQGFTPYMLDTSSPENEGDLRAYLATELKPYAKSGSVPSSTIEAVFARSEGLFLYVEQIRDELEKGRLSLNRQQEFPQGLGGVYAGFFRRQFPNIGAFKDSYRPVLELIVAARDEPLEVSYLATILGWNDYERRETLDSFGSLLVVANNRVQPFHKSIVDWLTDADRAGPYFVSAAEGHKRLADYGWLEFEQGTASMSHYMVAHLYALLVSSNQWSNVKTLSCDQEFIEAKRRTGIILDLLNDYDAALASGRLVGTDRLQVEAARDSIPEEAIAKAMHQTFSDDLLAKGYRWGPTNDGMRRTHHSLRPYADLPKQEREQNRLSAVHILLMLRRVSCTITPSLGDEPHPAFPELYIERLAEMEHQEWMKAKLRDGWRYARLTNKTEKFHAALVQWRELGDREKEMDRALVRDIPRILSRAGYKITFADV